MLEINHMRIVSNHVNTQIFRVMKPQLLFLMTALSYQILLKIYYQKYFHGIESLPLLSFLEGR